MPGNTGPATTTVLFWNIRAGGGPRRAQAILLELLERTPDIVALCECRGTFVGQLAASLSDHGLTHTLHADAPMRTNRVLLASRAPLAPAEVLGERVISASTRGLVVTVCHIPDSSQRRARRDLLAAAVGLARRHRDTPHLIAGDFNADRTRHPCRDGAAIGRLAALGYADLWTAAGGDPVEPTWTGPGGESARLDHLYASKPLVSQAQTVEQIHSGRDLGLSDHSMLMARFIHKDP